jgi:hypothetical protein
MLPCYIYHKNEKSKPSEKDLPSWEKTISHDFSRSDIYAFIADRTGFGLEISKRKYRFWVGNFKAKL